MTNRKIIDNIESIRKWRGIPKSELERRLGICKTGYSQMIRRGSFTMARIEALAKILDVPASDFFKDIG